MFEVVSQLLIYQRVRLCANLLWFDLDKVQGPILQGKEDLNGAGRDSHSGNLL
jgi:hypothetical protein